MGATGIPVEYLFTIIGLLIGAIYLDIKRGLKRLEIRGAKRDITLVKICERLKIHFENGDV